MILNYKEKETELAIEMDEKLNLIAKLMKKIPERKPKFERVEEKLELCENAEKNLSENAFPTKLNGSCRLNTLYAEVNAEKLGEKFELCEDDGNSLGENASQIISNPPCGLNVLYEGVEMNGLGENEVDVLGENAKLVRNSLSDEIISERLLKIPLKDGASNEDNTEKNPIRMDGLKNYKNGNLSPIPNYDSEFILMKRRLNEITLKAPYHI